METKHPPRPEHAPTVHLKKTTKPPPRTLKGDLKKLREAASRVTPLRKKPGETKAEAPKPDRPAELPDLDAAKGKAAPGPMEPVYRAIGTVRKNLDPANGRTRPYVTSFGISVALSWAVSPQIFAAAYERLRYGTSEESWGFLMGPGRWFRDTIAMADETGQTASLWWAVALGLLPMTVMFIRNYVTQGLARMWLQRAAWAVPVVFFTGMSYPEQVTALFGSPWTATYWQLGVAGLVATAWYCTMWVFDRVEKRHLRTRSLPQEERDSQPLGPGLFHAVLMVPLASIVSGFLLHAPGAAW